MKRESKSDSRDFGANLAQDLADSRVDSSDFDANLTNQKANLAHESPQKSYIFPLFNRVIHCILIISFWGIFAITN